MKYKSAMTTELHGESGAYVFPMTWKPSTRDDIAGKETLYATARVTSTGECVRLAGYADDHFTASKGRRFHWTQLDSFCL